ncbi:DUF6077 domain-containing protein [Phycicoccus sp. M110.8]|uniref:DUF6077 domain-containing protein n=1 Tax=Phycicoccus sp. M110.8 TaxID=3075433 RepID=UPI0028FD7E90|nr:DUF6077 domain-containing protein [Phycicoccus sp. M110.8]MDU0312711.1 DUF6077 domain-containing protein [Phycicoccus sp. M110.8]
MPRTPRPTRHDPMLDRVGDLVSDLGIWGLALWTVVYHAGRSAGVSTDLLVVVVVVVMVPVGVLAWRHGQVPPSATWKDATPRRAWPLLLVTALLTLAAVVVHWTDRASTYPLGWVLAVAALLPLVWLALTRDRADRVELAGHDEEDDALARGRWPQLSSAAVWGVALVLSYLSLLTVRFDADDVFYVNKAVFVAETGRIPLRDTIYSNQALPALRGAGTAPVQSIEVLQGAVAHLFGLSGGTVVYLLTPAVMSFLAVWAVWRLVRSWSPRRAVVAFAVAIAYLLWGVKDGYGLGAFWIGRIWQGKVMFVCLALPLLYLALTRWVTRGRVYDAALLFATGVMAVGLTSTATLVVPPIGLAVAAALLVCRYQRWWGALLPVLYPVGSGLIVSASSPSGQFGDVAFTSYAAYHHVVGDHLWGALGLTAILVAPWVARAGGTRVVVAAGSLAALVMMAPGMPDLVNRVTGAGPILYRLMWVPAIPVLVGLLATVSLPVPVARPARVLAMVLAPAAVLALILAGGRLLWLSPTTYLEGAPVWKFDRRALAQARSIENDYSGSGPVLAPWRVMRAIALTTATVHAVDPRNFYLSAIDEPSDVHRARIRLSASMKNGNPAPPATFAQDVQLLRVGYICLDAPKKRTTAAVLAMGWRQSDRGQGLTCYRAR